MLCCSVGCSQLPRRTARQHPQLYVDDLHHVSVCRLWRYCSKYVLRTSHFSQHRSHGKSFPSHVAHWAALISVLLALSQTPVWSTDGASVLRNVAVYFPAIGREPNCRPIAWWQRYLLYIHVACQRLLRRGAQPRLKPVTYCSQIPSEPPHIPM